MLLNSKYTYCLSKFFSVRFDDIDNIVFSCKNQDKNQEYLLLSGDAIIRYGSAQAKVHYPLATKIQKSFYKQKEEMIKCS